MLGLALNRSLYNKSMCGRFVRSSSVEKISRIFGINEPSIDIEPSYNIAPSQTVIMIYNDGVRRLRLCRWGLIPSWAKDLSTSSAMINARAETVDRKSFFRAAFRKHRCLVIANGFFEWKRGQGGKKPMYIRLKSHEPFGFAGLYSMRKSPKGNESCTCAIITTVANDLLTPVHDRMPVIVPREAEDAWIDPDNHDISALKELLHPYRNAEMEFYQVSTQVNSPSLDSADNIQPVDK